MYSTCEIIFKKIRSEYCNSDFNETFLSKHIKKVHSNDTVLLCGDYAKPAYVNSNITATLALHNDNNITATPASHETNSDDTNEMNRTFILCSSFCGRIICY